MKATVLILNPDLTHAVPPQFLQGLSGKSYGMSRWNAAHHCHGVEMTLEEFDRCWEDIQRAMHLPMRRWFPRFSVETLPAAVVDFQAGYEAGKAGSALPEEAGAATKAGYDVAQKEAAVAGGATPTTLPEAPETSLSRKQRKPGRGKSSATVSNGEHEVLQPE